MAAFGGIASNPAQALSAATARTVIQIVAAANHRVRIKGWGVFFDGVSVTAEPVVVELVRQSTAGTSDAGTVVKKDDSLAETLLTAARQNLSVEPTTGDILKRREVHPQQGWYEYFQLGDEVICGGGDRIGIRCTAPAVVNATGEIDFEE